MALTKSQTKEFIVGAHDGKQLVIEIGTVAFDNSYPTNGEAVTFGTNMREPLGAVLAPTAGYVFEYDAANKKIKAFRQKDPAAAGGADIALPEVGNTTDLSALTAVPFFAWGNS